MEKLFIKNREGNKLSIIVEKIDNQKGLAFVMHGLGGFKEQPHLEVMAEAFKEKGFTVVRFDAAHTYGESEGDYEQATITNYYTDLEDVIMWAKKQKWYQEPFALAGHSLGGISTALYTENHPTEILALAPISTVVSGALSAEAHKRFEPDKYEKWEKTGWDERPSTSLPGVVRRLPWSHLQDRLKYDLLPAANKLTMPVLLIVGENDTSTPVDHNKQLYDALPGPKRFEIIKNSPHTFRKAEHLQQVKDIFLDWIDSFLK